MNREKRNQCIREAILRKLLPANSLSLLILSYFFLNFTILALACFYYLDWIEKALFLILLVTVTCFVCFHGIVGGIFLFAHKIPYLKEWKEKLGYAEK